MTTADLCRNRHGGDQESLAAHDRAIGHAERDRLTILGLIRDRGTLTLDEACVALGRDPNQLSGRVSELKQKGAIVFSGEKRKTRTGCLAKAYKLAPPTRPSEPLTVSVETIQAIYVANGSTSSIAAKHNVPTTLAAEIRSGGRFRDVTRHLTRGAVPKRRTRKPLSGSNVRRPDCSSNHERNPHDQSTRTHCRNS